MALKAAASCADCASRSLTYPILNMTPANLNFWTARKVPKAQPFAKPEKG
jgi:hypothetical protein